MRREFDPLRLMPAESYLKKWLDIHHREWPRNGFIAEVFTGPFDHTQLEHMEKLVVGMEKLEEQDINLKGA